MVTTIVDVTHVISKPIIRTMMIKGDRFGLTPIDIHTHTHTHSHTSPKSMLKSRHAKSEAHGHNICH